MIYVCSDIHGRYDRWMKLLETINFGPDDTMYILGDTIDRGPDSIKLLLDIASRENVQMLLGNHEHMMLCSMIDITRGNINSEMIRVWTNPRNGGDKTLAAFLDASTKNQDRVLKLLQDDTLAIKIVEVNGKKFHLSHSFTLPTIEKDEYYVSELTNNDLNNICWMTPFRTDELFVPLDCYNKDYCYIIGHVPVQRMIGTENVDFISVNLPAGGSIIDIDLGCAFGNNVPNYLGCLRLDDMESFKID